MAVAQRPLAFRRGTDEQRYKVAGDAAAVATEAQGYALFVGVYLLSQWGKDTFRL
jgi:hypothetical protein